MYINTLAKVLRLP